MKVKTTSVLYAIICTLASIAHCNLMAEPIPKMQTSVLVAPGTKLMAAVQHLNTSNNLRYNSSENTLTNSEGTSTLENQILHYDISGNSHVMQQRIGSFAQLHNSPLLPVTFENDVLDLLMLSDKFENNPELPQQLIEHLSFRINGHEILPNEKKVIPIRTDRPFELSIRLNRGRVTPIASLLSALTSSVSSLKQTFSDQIKSACLKLADLLSFKISYKCAFQEKHLHNNVHYLAELICEHKEVREFLENPTYETARKTFLRTDRLEWSEDWLGVNFQLPPLTKET